MQKNIILIDRHPLIYHGIRSLCKKHDYHVINANTEKEDIYSTIINSDPHFIIMEMHSLKMKSAEVVRTVDSLGMVSRIIVFSEYDDLFYQNECLSLGIRAYIPKSLEPESIILAMSALDNGLTYYPSLKKRRNIRGIRTFDNYINTHLTGREQLVLKMLSAGKSVKDISLELSLSNKTISTYKQSLLEKLGADSLIEAVDIARAHQVL